MAMVNAMLYKLSPLGWQAGKACFCIRTVINTSVTASVAELTEPEWQACSGRQGRRREICCSRRGWETLENPKGRASGDQSTNGWRGEPGLSGHSLCQQIHSLSIAHTSNITHTASQTHIHCITHTHTYVLHHIQILCTTHTYTSCIPHSITHTHTPSDTHTTWHTSHTVQHTHTYIALHLHHTHSIIHTHTHHIMHTLYHTYTHILFYIHISLVVSCSWINKCMKWLK